jgi:hypothetical protein
MDRPILQRLVLEFRDGDLVARVLYRSSLGGPNTGTKARQRVVTELVREGLRQALLSLDSEAGVDIVGTSGFTQRQDVLLATTSSSEAKLVKKGA